MKLILLLAAIYSLIINQCYKTAGEKTPEGRRSEKAVNIGVLIGSVYKHRAPAFSSDLAAIAFSAETFVPAKRKQSDAK